ncbi:hypothetical protein BT69DRAFT_1331105 [Atractiella rhizophila]|nr:hypothetical protein BT69DRAFT_1331105 [Atractiella rhizophila]
MPSANEEIAQIVAQTQAGQVSNPWEEIAVVVHSLFFPTYPDSAKGQFIFISVVYAILLLLAIACLWLRRKSLPFFRRVDGYVVVNTPILFIGPIAIYLILSQAAIWKTIAILDGKRNGSYEGIYILRAGSWTFLYIAGWYKGLGTLIESKFTSQAIQKSKFAATTGRKTRLSSLVAAYVVPALHFIWLWPLAGAVSAVCDDAYHKWERLEDEVVRLAETNNLATFASDLQTLLGPPLQDLQDSSNQCVLVQRIDYATILAWVILTLGSVGGVAFFGMRKKLRQQVELHEKLAQDWKELSFKQGLALSYQGSDQKVRLMKIAATDLTVQGIVYFGCTVSWCSALIVITAVGTRGQLNGDLFVAIQLWAFYTFTLLGIPALTSSLRSAWIEGGAPPLYLQNELLNTATSGNVSGQETPKFRTPPMSTGSASPHGASHLLPHRTSPAPDFAPHTAQSFGSIAHPEPQSPDQNFPQQFSQQGAQWFRPASTTTESTGPSYNSYGSNSQDGMMQHGPR